jgi:dTDP-L-rhamnose 4-epimerase
VDNGSSDGSAEVAQALGSQVVEEPTRGFGAACAAGLAAAEAEVVCFMDCDGSLDGADLPRVAMPIASGDCDLVLGRRRPAAGAWPLHASIANRVLAAGVRHRTGIPLRDLGPMRAMRRSALVDLGMTDRRFGWPLEMVLRAADAG